jgi:hypothetical protein
MKFSVRESIKEIVDVEVCIVTCFRNVIGVLSFLDLPVE